MKITAGPVDGVPQGVGDELVVCFLCDKKRLDAYKMIFVDQNYFGKGGALQRVFLVAFFLGLYLFGHLAFTVAMQLRPGFVHTVPFISLLVGEVAQYNDPLAHGLDQEGCDQ